MVYDGPIVIGMDIYCTESMLAIYSYVDCTGWLPPCHKDLVSGPGKHEYVGWGEQSAVKAAKLRDAFRSGKVDADQREIYRGLTASPLGSCSPGGHARIEVDFMSEIVKLANPRQPGNHILRTFPCPGPSRAGSGSVWAE